MYLYGTEADHSDNFLVENLSPFFFRLGNDTIFNRRF